MNTDRRSTNPVFNDRKLKLGTFGTNMSTAVSITSIDGAFEATWPNAVEAAQLADEMAFEALVPVARWRGFGGETNFAGTSFEVFTWAAGLSALTNNVSVMATSHVPTVHPLVAAKQATTIDHISSGRFALNIVCGWFKEELEMFGAPMLEHDEAYERAEEWLTVIKRLWTAEEEFDFDGRYFQIKKGFHQPKPLQAPFPALMNAGNSERGRHFAAKNCDLAFIVHRSYDWDEIRKHVDNYRRLAREEYGRELQVWSYAYVVQRETEKEARDYLDYYVNQKGDRVAAQNLMRNLGVPLDEMPPAAVEEATFHFIAGWRGFPLVGTRDQVADGLKNLSDAGLDGILVVWAEYQDGLRQFRDETLPLLIQEGLR